MTDYIATRDGNGAVIYKKTVSDGLTTGTAFSDATTIEGVTGNKLAVDADGKIGIAKPTADETNVIAEYLLNGASSNQNVDGSVTPVTFSSTAVPTGKKLILSRAMIYMEDSTAFASTVFGGLASALTNGWEMAINGTVMFSAKTNWQLAIYMFDMTGNDLFGKANQTMVGRFSFSKFVDGADGITVRAGETVDTIVNDDLTGIDQLHVMFQGILLDE